jgi:hypothetical protein
VYARMNYQGKQASSNISEIALYCGKVSWNALKYHKCKCLYFYWDLCNMLSMVFFQVGLQRSSWVAGESYSLFLNTLNPAMIICILFWARRQIIANCVCCDLLWHFMMFNFNQTLIGVISFYTFRCKSCQIESLNV